MKFCTELPLQPMSTAPKVESPDRLLVVDTFWEMGQQLRKWRLVYWHGAWDGHPAGWCGNGFGDFREPVGWVAVLRGADAELTERALKKVTPCETPQLLRYELLLDGDDDLDLQYKSGKPCRDMTASFSGQTEDDCRDKLRSFLKHVKVIARSGKEGHARELQGYLNELAGERVPEGFYRGGNRTVRYRQLRTYDHAF